MCDTTIFCYFNIVAELLKCQWHLFDRNINETIEVFFVYFGNFDILLLSFDVLLAMNYYPFLSN